MKTILFIASILAALWVDYFIFLFIYWIERYVCPNDFTKVHFVLNKNGYYGKIRSWQTFWILVIRTTRWELQLLMFLTGAPIWGFILYMVVETIIIWCKRFCKAAKRFYSWLNKYGWLNKY